jgi:hypothetical protein
VNLTNLRNALALAEELREAVGELVSSGDADNDLGAARVASIEAADCLQFALQSLEQTSRNRKQEVPA